MLWMYHTAAHGHRQDSSLLHLFFPIHLFAPFPSLFSPFPFPSLLAAEAGVATALELEHSC